jgi:hypothetical protein
LEALFRYAVKDRMGTIILSALVAHTGWHWMLERGEKLSQFHFEWPVLTAGLLAMALRWLMLLVALAGPAWLVFAVLRPRWQKAAETKTFTDAAETPDELA